VTTSTEIAPSKNGKELAARIGWLVLICATLYVCYFSHLGAIGFVGPDEPRYAWIARDMAETGDWITPRLYGKPWFEKPPLYYWGAAISFKLFGVSEAAARLPSAISALLATLAMAWLAWRIYGAETARWLLLLLPTTVGMIGFSHAAAMDMPFSATLTVAMVCVAVVLRLPSECGGLPPLLQGQPTSSNKARTLGAPAGTAAAAISPPPKISWLALVLFGFFLGLAVLAKGPAAIILCGGSVFLWALFTKRWRDSLRLLHPVAVAAFCATALPWYILVTHRNPDFFRIFIIEHNFKRFLTPEFQHIQPFWFYVPIMFLSICPWSLFALFGCVDALRGHSLSRGSVSWFLLFWFGFTVLFFTLSQSKLPGYVLPAVPPLVLLTTRSWTGRHAEHSGIAKAPLFTGAFAVIGAAVLVAALRPLPTALLFANLPIRWWIAGIATAGLLLCALSLSRRIVPAAFMIFILVLSAVELSNRYLMPRLDQEFSARPATPLLLLWRDQNIRSCVYELQRSWIYGLDFYAHRELPECVVPTTLSFQAIASEKGLEDLAGMEKEQPERVHVTLFTGPRVVVGRNIRLVGIGRLPAGAPSSRQPQ
jgi:4-amino-4-deoxy-L-arabinose transferase-like glycosyltransferase